MGCAVDSTTVDDLCTMTESQIETVEEETRSQSKSKIWFRQRAGQVITSCTLILTTHPIVFQTASATHRTLGGKYQLIDLSPEGTDLK
jgi:hypothetical protein